MGVILIISKLVDNALDGAQRMQVNEAKYSDLTIDITISQKEFIIKDNCGGIDLDRAENLLFRFGQCWRAQS